MTSAIDPTVPRTGRASTSRVRGNYAAAKQEIETLQVSLLQVGHIIMYPAAAPAGYALCDGSEVSRAGNPDLFALVGLTFGSGDGSTTFNLPDLQDRMPFGPGFTVVGGVGGAAEVALTVGELPAHVHSTSEDGEHLHTTSSTGAHTHAGSTTSAGSHSHSGTSNTAGNHSHSVSTNSTGSHSHDDVRGNAGGSAGTGFASGQLPADEAPSTNSAGSHSHSVSNSGSGGSHSHSGSTGSAGSHSHGGSTDSAGSHNHPIQGGGAHTHMVEDSGAGVAHDNMPPWLTINYIIRLG